MSILPADLDEQIKRALGQPMIPQLPADLDQQISQALGQPAGQQQTQTITGEKQQATTTPEGPKQNFPEINFGVKMPPNDVPIDDAQMIDPFLAKDRPIDPGLASQLAKTLKPEDTRKFLEDVFDASRKRANDNEGIGSQVGRALSSGFERVAGTIGKLPETLGITNVKLSPEQLKLRDLILHTQNMADPIIKADDGFFKRSFLSSIQQSPTVAPGVALGVFSGRPAAAAYFAAVTAPEAFEEFRKDGLSEKNARIAALTTGIIEGAVEVLNVNPLSPEARFGKTLIGNTIHKVILRKVAGFEEELTEEFIQPLVRSTVEDTLKGKQGISFDRTFKDRFSAAVNDMSEAFGVVLAQAGPGSFASTVSEVRQGQIIRDAIVDPVGAAAFAERSPKAAQAVVDSAAANDGVPSRKAVEATGAGRTSVEQRRAIADGARSSLAAQEAAEMFGEALDPFANTPEAFGRALKPKVQGQPLRVDTQQQGQNTQQGPVDQQQDVSSQQQPPGELPSPESAPGSTASGAGAAAVMSEADSLLARARSLIQQGNRKGAGELAMQAVSLEQLSPEQIHPAFRPTEKKGFVKKGQKARIELSKSIDKLAKFGEGRLFSNPLDPELVKLVGDVAVKAVKAGVLTFADFVNGLANQISSELVRNAETAIRQQWDALAVQNDQLDQSTDVESVLSQRTGRPELANPAIDPGARELVRDVDERRKAEGRPDVSKQADVEAQADRLLDTDYEGERQRLLDAGKNREALNERDTMVAKKIVQQEGLNAVDSGDLKTIREVMDLTEAYRTVRTETGRALRIGFDPVERPGERGVNQITEALVKPTQKTQRRINRTETAQRAAERFGQDELAARLQRQLNKLKDEAAKEIAELKEKLRALGLDLQNLRDADPKVKADVIKMIQVSKADWWDAFYEWFRNAVLSAAGTNVVNAGGNLLHALEVTFVERLVEVAINAPRKGEKPTLGEFKYVVAGMMPGLRQGAKNFLKTWRSEKPYFENRMSGHSVGKFLENPNIAIGGGLPRSSKFGKALDKVAAFSGPKIRIPQRTLQGMDDLAMTNIVYMEIGAQALRIAKGEGLEKQDLQIRISELIRDRKSLAWQRSMQQAREITFKQRVGNIARATLDVRKTVPGSRYIALFVTTPANILKTGIKKSPLGTVNLTRSVIRGLRTGDWSGVSPQAAQQIIAWAGFMGIMSLVFDDGDDDPDNKGKKLPFITGAIEPRSLSGKRFLQNTVPRQSVRLFGQYWSYSRVEPFATALSGMVDFAQALKTGDLQAISRVPFQNIMSQVKNKSFLTGIGDIITILESEDPDKIPVWASNFAVSWVPNIFKQTGRSLQEDFPNRSLFQGPEWFTRLLVRTGQRTELGLIDDQPAVDHLGREVKRPQDPFGRSNFLWNFVSPIRNSPTSKITDIDLVFLNWNAVNPEDEQYPFVPRHNFQSLRKKYVMTADQYTEFLKTSGSNAQRIFKAQNKALAFDTRNPTERDIKRLKKVFSMARSQARKKLIPQWRRHGTLQLAK